MFVARTSFIDPLMFALARDSNRERAARGKGLEGGNEKTDFAW